MYEILSKEILNSRIEKMTIYAPYVAKRCEPGQFIILRVDKKGERIPLTIADYDREKETITIIYQIAGYTTELLSSKKAGDCLEDFLGPLGQPRHFNGVKRVLGIGGGVGVVPLYPQLKKLWQKNIIIDTIIGAQTGDFVILKEDIERLSNKLFITTNDGSAGTRGFVTDVLKQLLNNGQDYDQVIAIGPLAMMKAVVDITKPFAIPTSVSLNPLMIDGTGMCGGCRVTIDGKVKFACVDGPDFNGFLVDFDECISRQNYYKAEEQACRLALRGIENEPQN